MKKSVNLNGIDFEAFGVKIGLRCNDFELLMKIKKILPEVIPNNLEFKVETDSEHIFEIKHDISSSKIFIFKDSVELTYYFDESRLIEYLASQIRITVAEFAESKVFIHAGAVVWNNSGIIIPGKSYSGKTTLVSELIKHGAEYYSDEYAVLDEDGLLHPYPKMLSMRGIIDEYEQVDTSPEVFGAKIGEKVAPVKMILITSFNKEAFWNPRILKPGEGIMEILQHTIPIRFKPGFVLNVLKKASSRAIIAKCDRGEAELTIPLILNFLETVCL